MWENKQETQKLARNPHPHHISTSLQPWVNLLLEEKEPVSEGWAAEPSAQAEWAGWAQQQAATRLFNSACTTSTRARGDRSTAPGQGSQLGKSGKITTWKGQGKEGLETEYLQRRYCIWASPLCLMPPLSYPALSLGWFHLREQCQRGQGDRMAARGRPRGCLPGALLRKATGHLAWVTSAGSVSRYTWKWYRQRALACCENAPKTALS